MKPLPQTLYLFRRKKDKVSGSIPSDTELWRHWGTIVFRRWVTSSPTSSFLFKLKGWSARWPLFCEILQIYCINLRQMHREDPSSLPQRTESGVCGQEVVGRRSRSPEMRERKRNCKACGVCWAGGDAFAHEGPCQNKLSNQPHDWVLLLNDWSHEPLPSVKGEREDVCRPTSCNPNNTHKTSMLFPQRR